MYATPLDFHSKLRVKDHEFNAVIKEFCNEFESPKVRTVEDIIKFNEEHKDIALAERKTLLSKISKPKSKLTILSSHNSTRPRR